MQYTPITPLCVRPHKPSHLFGRVGPYNLYRDISLVLYITVAELRGETTHLKTMGEEIC